MQCEFSANHYREILEAVKHDIGNVSQRKRIVLAHDVDILPKFALSMAKIESANGVSATYYILPHAETYNALSPENIKIWKDIKDMGHELALHYDGRFDKSLELVASAVGSMLDTNITKVSHHLKDIIKDLEVPPALHNRGTDLKNDGYEYIADSGGWWRNGCVCQHLQRKLLFVCHPIWWFYPYATFSFLYLELDKINREACAIWSERVHEHRKQKV